MLVKSEEKGVMYLMQATKLLITMATAEYNTPISEIVIKNMHGQLVVMTTTQQGIRAILGKK